MKINLAPFTFTLILGISIAPCIYGFESGKPQIIETDKYVLYIPASIDRSLKYPLVIGFSPSADANGTIELWKDIAEKHKLIVAASKEFRNGIDPDPAFSTMAQLIKSSEQQYPIDKLKVITSGVSGGGMAAHMFSVEYPDLTWAVISNCGRVHPDYIVKERNLYAHGKLAVLLTSPSDFNYEHMKNDKRFLDGLDWKTKWIEFQGGHSTAPKESYEEAIIWLESRM